MMAFAAVGFKPPENTEWRSIDEIAKIMSACSNGENAKLLGGKRNVERKPGGYSYE